MQKLKGWRETFLWFYCAGQKVKEQETLKELLRPVLGRNTKSFEGALFPFFMRYCSFHRLCVKTTRFCTTRLEMFLGCFDTATRKSTALFRSFEATWIQEPGVLMLALWPHHIAWAHRACSSAPGVCPEPALGERRVLDLVPCLLSVASLCPKTGLLLRWKVLGYRLLSQQLQSYVLCIQRNQRKQ